MPDQAPDSQAREFATAFRGFLDWVHAAAGGERNKVSALARDFLGPDRAHHSVVTRELAPFEHVNLETAVDAWSALDDLLDTAQAVTRTLLGVGVDPADLPADGGLPAGPSPAAWTASGPRALPRRFARYGG